MIETLHIQHIEQLRQDGAFILDVRQQEEFDEGHIAGATLIPLQTLGEKLDELPKNETIYVYCRSGARSQMATELLAQSGFHAVNLEGGYMAYEALPQSTDLSVDPNRMKIEASGLQCPGPLLQVTEAMKQLQVGEQVEITVTDFGFCGDIEAWAKKTGHLVVQNEKQTDRVVIVIQKNNTPAPTSAVPAKEGTTMVVFSGDLDKALASFVIATGAKAMGQEVTMFFTFWGLNVVKNPQAPKVKKTGLDRMLSKMMPKSIESLPISKFNMFGLGSKMIQHVMKEKKVDALGDMIEKAEQLGVKMIACTMSMDVMAIERSELLPSVEIGGVGTYLGDASESNINLFI